MFSDSVREQPKEKCSKGKVEVLIVRRHGWSMCPEESASSMKFLIAQILNGKVETIPNKNKCISLFFVL